MDKREVMDALEEIALLLDLKGENPFKSRAYTNAARTLSMLDDDLGALLASGKLAEQKGIGEALVKKITELVTTGRLEYLDKLRAEFPATLLELLEIPGLGPKKIKLFYEQLQVKSLADLEAALRDGRVAALPGCGAKTAEKLLAGLERRRANAGLFLFDQAYLEAEGILAELLPLPQVARLEVAGSLRRYKEVTKDLDLIGASDDPAPVMAAFVTLPGVREVLAHGETKSSVVLDSGLQADLRLVPPATFPYALAHFTGSKDHNVTMRARALKRGMKISEWGLFKTAEGRPDELIPCADEAEFFARLGLRFIPPELREDRGEVAHAEQADFPRLVEGGDYRGQLHCHTLASDGANSIAELAAHAQSLGHSYLGITDHSRSSFQANGLDADRLLKQVAELRRAQAEMPTGFTLFAGVECDILPDGTLDYPDDVLAQLDYVIVSVHSVFGKSKADQTARVLRALANPYVRILGHATGRLLLSREAYELDVDAVIAAAAQHQVAIELNCHPRRLDLEWRRWRQARDAGVRCSLNSDAHSLACFDYVTHGIGFARKGWLGAGDIINCWDAAGVRAFFRRERQ